MLDEMPCVTGLFEAHDFEETVKGITDLHPDVLILDIRMPGGSGIDVLKTMTADIRPQAVIVFTNYAYPQYFDRCMELGADYCFDKSADIEKLVELIRTRSVFPEKAAIINT